MVLIPEEEERGRAVAEGTWEGESVRFLPRRLIVKLNPLPEDTETSLTALGESVAAELPGGRIVRPPRHTRRVVVEVAAEEDVMSLAAQVSGRDDVEYAEPDVVDRAALTPNDTRLGDQWSLPMVSAFDAWDLETGDPTVVIGIIDSGISMTGSALDHPDLDDATRIVLGTDFVDGGVPRDLNGHGTHVAGIAAAEGNNAAGVAGMNWGSRLYICRTLDVNGNGGSADFADAVEEIVDFAVANGLKAVINYSAGGGANQTKLDACNYASSNGMLLCAATGNDNAGPVIFPAAYSTTVAGVIAVGSTDDTDTVSSFSNVGPEVTVVAPGRNIWSTMPTYVVTIPAGPNYGSLNGTSMATPLVTGLAALMWSRHPSFTNAKIKDCLQSTAVNLGAGEFDNTWGHGRVDAEAAVRCGDIILPPTVIAPKCTSIVPALCPSVSPKFCPSISPAACPSLPPNLCPSRFPVLCPTSRILAKCPSRLPVLCPTSRIVTTCPLPSKIPATCPVPSASPVTCPLPSQSPAGCPVPSQVGICGPIPGPEGGLPRPGPAGELWYGEEGDYYWVDDQGGMHSWSEAEEQASAEAADYFWVDDQGVTHYWSANG